MPRSDQYFGAWAIHPRSPILSQLQPALRAASERGVNARGFLLADLLEADPQYELVGGVAVIPISGLITKGGDWLFGGTSTEATRKLISRALADSAVKSILLKIDSPGGTVAGVDDLASEIATANLVKPITTYIEDMGASAAYWLASQGSRIYANPSAEIGSIGVFTVIEDWSRAYENAGIEISVIRTGKYKGQVTGERVTEERKAEAQRIVDGMFALFKAAVQAGRKMDDEEFDAVSDGRVFLAEEAVALKLIDGVKPLAEVLSGVNNTTALVGGQPSRKDMRVMAEEEKAEAVAPPQVTIADLEAACVGADSAFILAQAKAGASVEQAKAEWIAALAKQRDEAEARALEAENQLKAAQEAARGNAPVVGANPATQTESAAGTATEQWNTAIKSWMEKGLNAAQATATVAKRQPELHAAYVAALNNR